MNRIAITISRKIMEKNTQKVGGIINTRQRKRNQEQSEEIENISDSKLNLEQFSLKPKPKLNPIGAPKQNKRAHLQVEFDKEMRENADSVDLISVEDVTQSKAGSSTNDNKLSAKNYCKQFTSQNKPENWEHVFENLQIMRKTFDAPVDTMGCDMCMDENAEPKDKRYQSLLALMLSSRTKDEITFAAMKKLKEHGCSVENILKTSDDELGKLIYPVAFWKNKVKFIKKSTNILSEQYAGDIPNTVEGLCKLPGVGPKMAYLCMKSAWGEVLGIGVDTHVDRISNRLGWCKTKTPEETRKALEQWLPQEIWSEVNHLLVGFGQQICKKLQPKCAECLNKAFCPYGQKSQKK